MASRHLLLDVRKLHLYRDPFPCLDAFRLFSPPVRILSHCSFPPAFPLPGADLTVGPKSPHRSEPLQYTPKQQLHPRDSRDARLAASNEPAPCPRRPAGGPMGSLALASDRQQRLSGALDGLSHFKTTPTGPARIPRPPLRPPPRPANPPRDARRFPLLSAPAHRKPACRAPRPLDPSLLGGGSN